MPSDFRSLHNDWHTCVMNDECVMNVKAGRLLEPSQRLACVRQDSKIKG